MEAALLAASSAREERGRRAEAAQVRKGATRSALEREGQVCES